MQRLSAAGSKPTDKDDVLPRGFSGPLGPNPHVGGKPPEGGAKLVPEERLWDFAEKRGQEGKKLFPLTSIPK